MMEMPGALGVLWTEQPVQVQAEPISMVQGL